MAAFILYTFSRVSSVFALVCVILLGFYAVVHDFCFLLKRAVSLEIGNRILQRRLSAEDFAAQLHAGLLIVRGFESNLLFVQASRGSHQA